jgi:hypothetical protein
MALGLQRRAGMVMSPITQRSLRGGLVAVAVAGLVLAAPAAGVAAPSDEAVLPPEQHTSDKGKRLASTYLATLREFSAKIYHCMPWVEVKRNGIGFYKPRHLEGDPRYLSVNLYIDQQPSAEFAAYPVEEQASRMFSRYVGPMLRRMGSPTLLSEGALDGFTVILEWLKQTPAPGTRPVHETIAVFVDKTVAADYVGGRLPARELAARARVLGWDGDRALGPLPVTAWDDDFVSTYKVANYQLAPGVSCP